MAVTRLKQIWENEYFKTAVMIILTFSIVYGFWFGAQTILNTQYPALAVASGSMCTLSSYCDGWSHPFEPTLHVGDVIIVQGIDPEQIKAAPYPEGDIIVFRRPQAGDELIVHRAIKREIIDGKIFFETKGDGNTYSDPSMVQEDQVVGKVVLRIPWVGHFVLFMHSSFFGIIIIFFLIILLIVEFFIPTFR